MSETALTTTASKKDLQSLLNSDDFQAAVKQVLPQHASPERFMRMAIQSMNRTPDLLKCTQASVVRCLMDLSMYGLEPDGRRAHLIPFKRSIKEEKGWKTIYECQLIIDYKGLAELIHRSGCVKRIHADVVCENDRFIFDLGEIKEHTIDFSQQRGNVYAAYALCELTSGAMQSCVMTKLEIEQIRQRSRSKDNGPWVTDWNEMAKKTAFRRLSKMLPLSAELRSAVEYEDVEDISPPPPPEPKRPLFIPSFEVVETETPFDPVESSADGGNLFDNPKPDAVLHDPKGGKR